MTVTAKEEQIAQPKGNRSNRDDSSVGGNDDDNDDDCV
eukprot:CAMPEP_0203709706 /NCGR_PEP_ID=MMETSP0091-20130426/62587_1 /ASSEMBLY_ACC=CAM_ASM_001089 /TAXON_ID=426623 /ORGANISM="Chaetoceros affinis, Strain CCMP159" /LENGTH=37 /DNA_ID= /DNA_START= /DNA_END= /DNA_ORIENTATION=